LLRINPDESDILIKKMEWKICCMAANHRQNTFIYRMKDMTKTRILDKQMPGIQPKTEGKQEIRPDIQKKIPISCPNPAPPVRHWSIKKYSK